MESEKKFKKPPEQDIDPLHSDPEERLHTNDSHDYHHELDNLLDRISSEIHSRIIQDFNPQLTQHKKQLPSEDKDNP
jgi:hypothetical protein